MGSCISKCKPSKRKNSNKNEEEEEDQGNSSTVQVPVEDKLVITTSENPQLKSPAPPFPSLSTAQNPPFLPLFSPSHSAYSSSSSSSNTCLSTASSCASSISNSKGKPSFSKEFLQSRLNQNPQIVVLDPTKLGGGGAGGAPSSLPPHNRAQPQIGSKWQGSGLPSRPSSPAAGPAQKRQRASSPLTGQKSFRKDPVGHALITGNRTPSFRSPSPSRRFSSTQHERSCKRATGNSKVHGSYGKSNINVVSNSVKKQNPQAPNDPNNRSRRSFRSPSIRKQTDICNLNKVVSKVDGMTIGEEVGLSSRDVEMFPAEDLDNPLIALDCFIFL